MSALILVSRITGFIRTWAMAFALGNTFLAASYSLANNLPNMIYELVAGGVLSTAFLPIYMQQRNAHSREAANDYVSNLLSIGSSRLRQACSPRRSWSRKACSRPRATTP